MPTGPRRIVVLASGTGSTLQALLDAGDDPAFGARVVAVGADRPGTGAAQRAERRGVPSFVVPLADFPTRTAWDRQLADTVGAHDPDVVVSAGFMKLVGAPFLDRFGDRYVNSHPALLPSFPGTHAVRDALRHGVKITGCTLFLVDAGVDTGPIVDQRAVPVLAGDDDAALHERIKAAERQMLVDGVGRMLRDGWTVDGRTVTFGRTP